MESVGVKGATPLFSSLTPNWATPSDLYRQLYDEFLFTLDPCPLRDAQIWDGAAMSWAGERVYCNPPYGRGIDRWLAKAREAKLAVYLLPARTDTAWWHDYAMSADEIRFIRGRLRFNNQGSAPFPSVVLIYGS
jgi:site-specific DNA-methyltransferase (adenine-specific)